MNFFTISILVIGLFLIIINNILVLAFKVSYYETKLKNRGIDDSVKDIKTIIGVIKLR